MPAVSPGVLAEAAAVTLGYYHDTMDWRASQSPARTSTLGYPPNQHGPPLTAAQRRRR